MTINFWKGKQAKMGGQIGIGMEIIDMDAAEARGISVFNTPEGNRNAVAEQEHAIGLLLCLYRNLLQTNQGNVKWSVVARSKSWRRNCRKTIELIDLAMQSRFASPLSAFE